MTDKKAAQLSRRNFLKGSAVGSTVAMGLPLKAISKPAPKRLAAEDREVIIVGSGFGGAITAHRLTEAGIACTVIEKGKKWPISSGKNRTFSKNLPADGRSTWLSNRTSVPLGPQLPVNRYTGVLQRREKGRFKIMSGAAYGGGSITYGGILAKPDAKLFAKVFPKQISFEQLQPFYTRVAEKLSRSCLPEDLLNSKYYKHVRVTKNHAEKAGIKTEDIPTATNWDVVRKEVNGEIPPSVIHGEAIYGVNSGAKATLDSSYLREAENTGLMEVKTLHRVTLLSQLTDGRFHLELEEIDEKGQVIALKTFFAKKVFLSAGTMGTTEILVKAKAKGWLNMLNEEVGKGFGNNGNVYALRLGIKEPLGRWQGGPPSIGLVDFHNDKTPVFIEHPQLPLGLDFRGLIHFGIGITPTRGRFEYNTKTDAVELIWPKQDKGQELVNAVVVKVLKQLNKANGGVLSGILTLF